MRTGQNRRYRNLATIEPFPQHPRIIPFVRNAPPQRHTVQQQVRAGEDGRRGHPSHSPLNTHNRPERTVHEVPERNR